MAGQKQPLLDLSCRALDTTDTLLEHFGPFVPLLAPPVLMEMDSGDVQLKDNTKGIMLHGSNQAV